MVKARDQRKQGRLAGAVEAKENGELTGPDSEAHVVKGVQVAEAMTDPGNLEGGGYSRRRFGTLGQGFRGLQSRTPLR